MIAIPPLLIGLRFQTAVLHRVRASVRDMRLKEQPPELSKGRGPCRDGAAALGGRLYGWFSPKKCSHKLSR